MTEPAENCMAATVKYRGTQLLAGRQKLHCCMDSSRIFETQRAENGQEGRRDCCHATGDILTFMLVFNDVSCGQVLSDGNQITKKCILMPAVKEVFSKFPALTYLK